MSEWQVLVIEDESDTRELVQDILEYHKITTLSALTAEHALDVLKQHTPTLILVDLALPGMSGWEFLSELQRDPRLNSIPCVAFTAYHSSELVNKAIEAGFAAYFPKPLDATSFIRELQAIVENRL
ncbi:MAG: response regulator [Anaerolineae bacterium]|nr:response regulator [Anaerolineae bacterium]